MKRKKTGRERQSKRGGSSRGRFGTIRKDDSSGSASTRRVRCGAGDGASRRRRRRRRRDDADDADDRGSRRERGHRVFAANGRSVGHSFGWARARNENNESRQTRDDGWMTRTLGEVVRSSPSPGDGNVSLPRPRSRASSVRRRRRDSRRRDDRQRMYPGGTLHVTRVITRGCLHTGTFASHNS